MATEEQLLNVILDDGSTEEERATAVNALKKLTGKDRGDPAAEYLGGIDNDYRTPRAVTGWN
jgi:hypothetical protein